jgi:hypothetical protein
MAAAQEKHLEEIELLRSARAREGQDALLDQLERRRVQLCSAKAHAEGGTFWKRPLLRL